MPMSAAARTMFIDPHAHMISQITDDYQAMSRVGVAAVIEPALWISQPRTPAVQQWLEMAQRGIPLTPSGK